MKAARPFETPGTTLQTTQRRISEDPQVQQNEASREKIMAENFNKRN
jgi:hypothetical protein